jgi:hypothetical protein
VRAGTIVATNYLEMARLLGRSFLDAHPGSTFVVLLVDDHPVDVGSDGIEVVRLADLDLDDDQIDLMRTIYDVMELSTAVKPAFLRLLLRADDLACYIDPDIYVYRAFDELVEPARTVGIVLTPHVLVPIPRDGLAPSERMIMQAGIFNLGFIAVGLPGVGFLDWWQERLVVDAVNDVASNLFTDQRWIDWVPALFDHEVCRDPGMNIAWWNIHERRLERVDGGVLANGRPVRFVHYSGYSPAVPDVLSKHHGPAPRTEHTGVIRELATEYGRRLTDAGHLDRIGTPYAWHRSDTGIELTAAIRSLLRRSILGGRASGGEVAGLDRSVPLAFGSGSDRLRDWLVAPGSDHFSRVEVALWDSRGDLRTAFPDREGADAERYRAWLDRDPGAVEALGDLVERPTVQPTVVGRRRRLRRVLRR